jgi:hypothetical protein
MAGGQQASTSAQKVVAVILCPVYCVQQNKRRTQAKPRVPAKKAQAYMEVQKVKVYILQRSNKVHNQAAGTNSSKPEAEVTTHKHAAVQAVPNLWQSCEM